MTDRFIGKKIGPYRIDHEVGRGGMGVVYRGHQESLHRTVAIKVLPQSLATDPEMVSRFQQEARAIAGIHHENVVQIHDIFEARGNHFLVMEFLDGVPLSVLIERRVLTQEQVLAVGRSVAHALAAVHQRGIVHRDIKSHNVMVTRDGKVKLMDFGIARVQGGVKTVAGTILGTPDYMAPEQVQSGEITPRTDIYSLGVLLYEMATGQLPFQAGDTFALAMKHVTEQPRPPRQVNPVVTRDLEATILCAMSKDPARRQESALLLEKELVAIGSARGQDVTVASANPKATVLPPPPPVPAEQTPAQPAAAVPAQVSTPDSATLHPSAPAARALPGPIAQVPGRARELAAAGLAALVGLRAATPQVQLRPSARLGRVSLALLLLIVLGVGLSMALWRDRIEITPTTGTVSIGSGTGPTVAQPLSPAPADEAIVALPDVTPDPPQPEPEAAPRPAVEEAPARPEPVVTAPEPEPLPEPEPTKATEDLDPYDLDPRETFVCSDYVEFDVSPEEALIFVDGEYLGIADEWDGQGGGDEWRPAMGSYDVEISCKGYESRSIRIILDAKAEDSECDIDFSLRRLTRDQEPKGKGRLRRIFKRGRANQCG